MKPRGAPVIRRALPAAQRGTSGFSTARAAQGFTLIEIMVVIALLGGLAAILVLAASRALLDRADSPKDVFWGMVGEVRKYALHNEVDVTLSFDAEDQVFRASSRGQERAFPVPLDQPIELDFLGGAVGEQTVLIGGQLVETNVIDQIMFFSDGTCLPFRARLAMEGRPDMLFEIDPWTCAPILRAEDSQLP